MGAFADDSEEDSSHIKTPTTKTTKVSVPGRAAAHQVIMTSGASVTSAASGFAEDDDTDSFRMPTYILQKDMVRHMRLVTS